jgi:hypothetical protein
MTPKPANSVYRIVPAKDGTYAVEARSGRETPLTISGFKTEEEARAWVEAQGAETSGKIPD